MRHKRLALRACGTAVAALAIAMIAPGGQRISAQTSSVLVRVNQVGYFPTSIKRATVVVPATTTAPVDWQLRDQSGAVVLSGQTIVRGNDTDTFDFVHIVDFSAWQVEGTGYTLAVDTGSDSGVSYPFAIGSRIYQGLKYDAVGYFYHSRSGIAIEMPYAGGEEWTRPAGHLNVPPNLGDYNVPCGQGIGCSYSLDVIRGWYDAGDHGKYLVPGGISVWTLMNQYERALHLGTSVLSYRDGKMNIPENANGMPDLLDEIRWNLDFMLAMQVPAGEPRAGMAHHKMHDVNWTGIPTRPDLDAQVRHLRPVSTAATMNLAATAAQCARIWADIDPPFADRCLTAAETAWAAGQSNPTLLASGADGTGGGAYSDGNVTDERYWAAAELYVTTGRDVYRNFITSSTLFRTVPLSGNTSMTWGGVAGLGTISLAVVPNGLPSTDITISRNNILTRANTYRNFVNTQGYGVPFSGNYPWGSNSFILNNAIILALAYDFTGDQSYLDSVVQGMDYVLGRNGVNKSYVSGYGSDPMRNPHHRFWANQANPDYPLPPPGVVSGGPNSALQDPTAQTLAGCRRQKCYLDDYRTYSINEVAINWNAPLAWVAAWLDEKSRPADLTAPVLTLPGNQVVEATGPSGAVVSFSGSAHDDVDGDLPVVFNPSSGSVFPIGTTTVVATAVDDAGNMGVGEFTVTVQDTTAPVIHSLTPSRTVLWPPNHQMVHIQVAAIVSDIADTSPFTRIIEVTSNEPVNGIDDGNTSPDWEITGDLTVDLRAERSGVGTGRVYTVTVESRDASGNTAVGTTTVSVPLTVH